ncbi:MAG: LUD domain-containing protein [Chloroflexi bacterium]|nr:LUD domain-containing protein [Chloroflexota bacterium]
MSVAGSSTLSEFRQRATIALADIRVQGGAGGATGKFRDARTTALATVPDVAALRDHLKAVRRATISNLAHHLETFERQATAAGVQVHWAADSAEASQIVVDIAQKHGATLAAKSKSMATEEISLNEALLAAGVEPVETDLGEWIIQLSEEPPYHIIAPAIHKTRGQVAELFEQISGQAMDADDIPKLTEAARHMLRQKFLEADVGISGTNIARGRNGQHCAGDK